MTYTRTTGIMIITFKDKELEKVYRQEYTKRFSLEIQIKLQKKLMYLDDALNINELRKLPSNHFEKLEGDMRDLCSIRVNKQYRICFRVIGNDLYDLEVLDYH